MLRLQGLYKGVYKNVFIFDALKSSILRLLWPQVVFCVTLKWGKLLKEAKQAKS